MIVAIFWWALLLDFSVIPAEVHSCLLTGPDELTCKTFLPMEPRKNIATVTIENVDWTNLEFDVLLNLFPDVQNLTVIGNNRTAVNRVTMPHHPTKIKALRLTGLLLKNLSQDFRAKFPELEVLNISGNFFTQLPNISYDGLKEVYLLDNRWNCSNSLEWSLELNLTVFRDLDRLICFKMPHNNKPLLEIAKFQKEIQQSCTPRCSCCLIKCVTNPITGELEPIIQVNCTKRGFKELPTIFPRKTKIMHLESNEIQDLGPLRETPLYEHLQDLYLDENKIQSIMNLEGSYWLTHFRIFSLAKNNLSELPTYAIDNALQRNINMPDAVGISLGGNPWRCSCHFTPDFQTMLQKYAPQIRDLSNIRCANSPGDENSMASIMGLSRGSVCHSPSEYTIQEVLNLVNATLSLLIIFILGKLAYDYYNFKKTGRLPWIVTKMP